MADLPPVSANFDDPLPESPDPALAPYRSRGPTGTTTGYLPRRPLQPPQGQGGVPIPDMEQYTKQAMAYYPIDQAGKAIEMATKFVGQRGYQQDLANGMSAAQAFAKWGPMLFHGTAGTGMAAAIRGSQPPAMTPYQQAEISLKQQALNRSTTPTFVQPDTTTGAPGYFATPSGTIHTVPTPKPPKTTLSPEKQIDDKALQDEMRAVATAMGAASPKQLPKLEGKMKELSDKRKALLETPAPNKPGGPLAVGTVKAGFRYKGGDPSKKENWEKYPG
jgi:hypothetical protein